MFTFYYTRLPSSGHSVSFVMFQGVYKVTENISIECFIYCQAFNFIIFPPIPFITRNFWNITKLNKTTPEGQSHVPIIVFNAKQYLRLRTSVTFPAVRSLSHMPWGCP